jgi:hypothetical protein
MHTATACVMGIHRPVKESAAVHARSLRVWDQIGLPRKHCLRSLPKAITCRRWSMA